MINSENGFKMLINTALLSFCKNVMVSKCVSSMRRFVWMLICNYFFDFQLRTIVVLAILRETRSGFMYLFERVSTSVLLPSEQMVGKTD